MTEDEQKQQANKKTAVSQGSKKAHRNFTGAVLLVLLCFIAGFGGGYTALRLNDVVMIDRSFGNDGNNLVVNEEETIADIAKRVSPSVVSITTTGQKYSFFGDQVEEGAGSGFILSADGLVLTNKHVVKDSTKLTVIGSDGALYDKVEIIGTDPLNDLAFLKIKGVKNLKPVKLGDSSSVSVGQKVIAIGNSLGEFQNTVTSGIISGTGRPIYAQEGGRVESLTDLLQTDAAINPGNSGGPLVNLAGQVIGVNTAIAEDAQSVGFSIPINAAKGIIKHLNKTGKVERAYLGVNYIQITPEVAREYDLPVTKGGYVFREDGTAISSGSPAQKAGIKDKDIITKVGDLVVGKHGSVASLVSEYATGDTVKITVLRDGKSIEMTVKLATYGD